jgi:hypothetical protein
MTHPIWKREEFAKQPGKYRTRCFDCRETQNKQRQQSKAKARSAEDAIRKPTSLTAIEHALKAIKHHTRSPKSPSNHPITRSNWPVDGPEATSQPIFTDATPIYKIQSDRDQDEDLKSHQFNFSGSPTNALSTLEPVRQQVVKVIRNRLKSEGTTVKTLTMQPVAWCLPSK